MGRTRVLSVIQSFPPAFSGEAEWWLRMIPRLRARRVDVTVLTSRLDFPDDLPTRDVVDGIRVERVGSRDHTHAYVGWILAIIRNLVSRRGQFDLALFHSTNRDAVYVSCILGRLFGWKTIYKMTLMQEDNL